MTLISRRASPQRWQTGRGHRFRVRLPRARPGREADFLAALKPGTTGDLEVHITIRYAEADKAGRLRAKRWCADHEDVGLTSDMMENLRGVYLPPLRDASQGLKPSRTSQLARLFQLLADDAHRFGIRFPMTQVPPACVRKTRNERSCSLQLATGGG
jgi:hypothetical protein